MTQTPDLPGPAADLMAQKLRRILDEAEERTFSRIDDFLDEADIDGNEAVKLLERLNESDLAEKYGNWLDGY